jgi:general secretion pathway protein L
MKCLGVDIGSSSIKIAEVEGSGRSVSLTQIWEIGLSTDPTKDQALEVIEKLRAFSGQYPGKDVRWVIAVPQNSVSTRLKRFPFLERSKILKSLPFELEEEIPFDASETIFDARVVETFANGSDVLAIACPNGPIEQALQLAKDGGFEAEIISVEGLALSNILDAWWSTPPHSSVAAPIDNETSRTNDVRAAHAILQIGHTRTNIVVFRDNHIVAVRSIQWGGHDVALALEATFKIPYIEATKVLQTKSFVLLNIEGASRDQVAMHKAVSEAAIPLIRELRLTLLDLRSSAGADLRDLRLTGAASQIQNLAPWLSQALEVSVNPLDYFGALAASGKMNVRVSRTPELENASATAIGLALEGMRKPRNPAINLRKGPFAQSNESVRLFWETWKSTLQIAAVIFVILCAYTLTRESLTLQLAERSDETLAQAAKNSAGLKGSQASADGITKYIRNESRSIQNRETLARLDTYIPAMEFVAKLAEKMPVQLPPRAGRGLDVDRLTIENDDLTIEGRTQGADILVSVKRELQSIAKAGTLKEVKPTSLRPNAPGTGFGFVMKINRKP